MYMCAQFPFFFFPVVCSSLPSANYQYLHAYGNYIESGCLTKTGHGHSPPLECVDERAAGYGEMATKGSESILLNVPLFPVFLSRQRPL